MDASQWPKVMVYDFHKETERNGGISASNSSSSHSKQKKNKKTRPNNDQALNCPRCNSTNTKFCYYNNYNPSQPRYLCKGCRRYWTHGGTLRNVPVGGASRRKINKPSSFAPFQSNNSRFFLDLNPNPTATVSSNQDLNKGLYHANAHHQFLPKPSSLFGLSPSQGADMSPYHQGSISPLAFNFQDIVKPTLNLSMGGGFGSTTHDRSNMEGGGVNPYLFGEVKQVSATRGDENVTDQTNAQMGYSSNGVIYWNNNNHGLYN